MAQSGAFLLFGQTDSLDDTPVVEIVVEHIQIVEHSIINDRIPFGMMPRQAQHRVRKTCRSQMLVADSLFDIPG